MNGLEISGEQQPVHGVPRRLGDDRVLNEEGNDAVGDLAQCWVREEVQDLEVEVSRSEASVFDETWRVGMRLLRGRESWAEMVQAVVFEMFGNVEANKKVLFNDFWEQADKENEVDVLRAEFDAYFIANNSIKEPEVPTPVIK